MIGKSHLRGDNRNFRLERMSEVTILEEKITKNEKIDVEGLIFRSNEGEQKIVVVLDDTVVNRFKANLPAKIIREKRKNSNKIRLEFFFNNMEFINEWSLQFGSMLTVEEPSELKKKREDLLKKMLNQ